MLVLEIEHLCKKYRGGCLANDNIDLAVAPGQVYGLLGHNGAGKTTLVNQVVGLSEPTSGQIRIAGGDAVADPAFARRVCAVQPQSQVPLRGVTPAQAVRIVARIRGAGRTQARAAAEELFTALEISAWAGIPGERLSGGVRRLAAFCMAAAGPSQLVILDEPTNDVDPVRRRLLWEQIRLLSTRGRGVLVVTHNVGEAERWLDRVSILQTGRVVAEGTPEEVRSTHGPHRNATLEETYLALAGRYEEGSDAALAA